jgi:hypothetical protein
MIEGMKQATFWHYKKMLQKKNYVIRMKVVVAHLVEYVTAEYNIDSFNKINNY